jgi:hypothetical protein
VLQDKETLESRMVTALGHSVGSRGQSFGVQAIQQIGEVVGVLGARRIS